MTNTNAVEALKAAKVATEEAKGQTILAVYAAHDADLTWTQIGAALGISKQTAHARYGKLRCHCGCNQPISKCTTPLPDGPARDLTPEEEDREALGEAATIFAADVAGTSETPSIFSDATAPATKPKRPNGPKNDPDESIRNGIANTAGKPIDWTAAQSLATTTPKKCPYCNQRTHYATRTGNWWVYADCTITHDDLGTKAVQDSYQENNA